MTGQILSRTTDTDQNTVLLLVGTFAVRPAASTKDQLYLAYDTGVLYRDSGTAWATTISSGASVGTAELTDFKVADVGSGTGLIVSVGVGNFRDGTTTTAITTANQTLTNNATNYIEVDPATPSVSVNATSFTAGSIPIAEAVTSGGNISSITDRRAWIVAVTELLDDTSPQLGGALDMNSQNITAAGPTTITPTEVSYLDGVTSAVQTQIDGKAATSHNHAASDVTSGTLVHEQGGMEADVSAFNGLTRISGGATTEVTDTAGLNTALSATVIDHEAVRAHLAAATQNITNNTWTSITFDGETYDTDTMHDNVTNNTRITFTTAGKYHVTAHVFWDANVTGGRHVRVLINAASVIISDVMDPFLNSGVNQRGVISFDYAFVATDYIEIQVFQDSGGTRTVNGGAGLASRVTAHKIAD